MTTLSLSDFNESATDLSAPVDVLAVLDEFALYVRNVSSRHALQGDILETRSAVAELIEAADALADYVAVANDSRGICNPDLPDEHPLRVLWAALARCKGGAA